MVKRAC